MNFVSIYVKKVFDIAKLPSLYLNKHFYRLLDDVLFYFVRNNFYLSLK